MCENKESELLQFILSSAFLCGVPPSRSLWQNVKDTLKALSETLSGEQMAQVVLSSTIRHPYTLRFPRDDEHIQRVLDWIKEEWKANDWSGLEAFTLDIPIPLQNGHGPVGPSEIGPTKIGPPEVAYKTYIKSGEQDVTLLESTEGILRGTTGLSSWGAAKVLSSWFVNQPLLFRSGVKIIELGAGVGYNAVSILSSMGEDSNLLRYHATDFHPHVLALLHHNLTIMRDTLNQNLKSRSEYETFRQMISSKIINEELLPGSFAKWDSEQNFKIGGTQVDITQLNWSEPPEVDSYDVILASDITYATHLFPDLVAVIRTLLSKKRPNRLQTEDSTKFPVAYIACTRRNQETLNTFLEEVRQQGLKHNITWKSHLERDEALFWFNESHIPIFIYEIRLDETNSQ